MKKILSLFAFVALLTCVSFAQLADGTIAPNWTLTDINGDSHTLYDYLDDGYTVVLDFSATWCGPCWDYHTSGELEDLYINHGPAGMANVSETTTNDIMVFMIEGDASTTDAQLNGAAGSQGDWVAGTPYPIIDDASLTSAWVDAWPTLYTICPNGIVNRAGQDPVEAHYANVGTCALESYDISTSSVQAASDDGNDFVFIAENTNDIDEVFMASVVTDAPSDWTNTLSAAGVSGSNEVEFTGAALVTENVTLSVMAGPTAAFATYTVTLSSVTYPDSPTYSLEYNVLSGVTDLVIDNGGVATSQNIDFTNGLELAGNTSYAVMGVDKFMDAATSDQLNEIGHMYYNMAWTFPSFTNDVVEELTAMIDNGVNFYVSGQDIGWDTWDANAAANGTPQTQAFYTDYLSADYQGDGSGSNNQLNWQDQNLFIAGGAVSSAIVDIHGGNIYPDEFDAIAPAIALFHYGNNENTVGGVRVEENNHKIVYVGVDQAMIADEDVRNKVIQISHDWFHGIISGLEADEAFAQVFGTHYPNPAINFTIIPIQELTEEVAITLMDAQGKVVFEDVISKGTSNYRLDLANLNAGLYHYVVTNAEGKFMSDKIEVIK
ncbi:MAG: hypothetical protein ACI8XB_001133 [Patiriisocius sp.]|jgi:hypothetical protein